MRVVVDPEVCEGNAVCMGLVPGVFDVQGDEKAHVIDAEPAQELRGKVEEAVRACPTQAIRLED